MNITIKPYSKEYAKQCADLLQYLWRENENERNLRFNWAYNKCPNFSKPLSVIAINEKGEVVGFRGYFLNSFLIYNKEFVVAQITDTVVSPKARRMGVFQRMNEYSLKLLAENNIPFILNLSPSWPPYYGYKKIDFKDLAPFHSLYRFSILNLIKKKLLRKSRISWINKKEQSLKDKEIIVTQQIDDIILKQLTSLTVNGGIKSSLHFENIKWRTERPGRNYVYTYSLDSRDKLSSFMMLSTKDFFSYNLGLFLYKKSSDIKDSFTLFKKIYKPTIVSAWDFAIDQGRRKVLKKIGMIKIPFINKMRNNPPSMIRTLEIDKEGKLDWKINDIDIQEINNWSINKLDLDSF